MATPHAFIAAMLAAGILGTHPTTTPTADIHTTPPTLVASASEDRTALEQLGVAEEDTGAHYRRQQWGGWTTGPGGCDTRETVLRRDAAPTSIRIGPGCRVLAGRWVSTYDRLTLTTPAGVQIDHRVPLAEAARSGARGWTRAQRERFANDPANLVAVSVRANTGKGDRDPGRWRPLNRAVWCDYAAGYVATKRAYRLSVDAAERAGLAAMLRTCPGGAR